MSELGFSRLRVMCALLRWILGVGAVIRAMRLLQNFRFVGKSGERKSRLPRTIADPWIRRVTLPVAKDARARDARDEYRWI